jgi:hypothetical protein
MLSNARRHALCSQLPSWWISAQLVDFKWQPWILSNVDFRLISAITHSLPSLTQARLLSMYYSLHVHRACRRHTIVVRPFSNLAISARASKLFEKDRCENETITSRHGLTIYMIFWTTRIWPRARTEVRCGECRKYKGAHEFGIFTLRTKTCEKIRSIWRWAAQNMYILLYSFGKTVPHRVDWLFLWTKVIVEVYVEVKDTEMT